MVFISYGRLDSDNARILGQILQILADFALDNLDYAYTKLVALPGFDPFALLAGPPRSRWDLLMTELLKQHRETLLTCKISSPEALKLAATLDRSTRRTVEHVLSAANMFLITETSEIRQALWQLPSAADSAATDDIEASLGDVLSCAYSVNQHISEGTWAQLCSAPSTHRLPSNQAATDPAGSVDEEPHRALTTAPATTENSEHAWIDLRQTLERDETSPEPKVKAVIPPVLTMAAASRSRSESPRPFIGVALALTVAGASLFTSLITVVGMAWVVAAVVVVVQTSGILALVFGQPERFTLEKRVVSALRAFMDLHPGHDRK